MSTYRQSIGVWGEEQACLWLKRKGFTVVDRNFHTTQGEIDVVASKGGDYYFIEVKTREAGELATDLAITKSKLKKLDKTIKRYCYLRNISEIHGLITAGLLIIVDKPARTAKFRLAAYS